MARSSSRSAPSRPAPKPAARAPPPAPRAPAPAPAPAPSAAPPAHMPQQSSGGGGMLAGLGATMAQGFAFGTGSALAREAVGSFMGSGKEKSEAPPAAPVQQQQVPAQSYSGPCAIDHQAFMSCLNNNAGNASYCDTYYSALQACQGRQ